MAARRRYVLFVDGGFEDTSLENGCEAIEEAIVALGDDRESDMSVPG